MNSVDRVIGALYKDLDFPSMMNTYRDILIEGGKIIGKNILVFANSKPNLEPSDFFLQLIKKTYLNRYNYDYSEDELEILLEWVFTDYCCNKSNTSSNKGLNTGIDLIKTITLKYIQRNNKELTVEFDSLLEWNGFINKLDYNIFYSAFMVFNNIDLKLESNHLPYITHNSNEIKKILKRGISENHMHFKGSGYTIDWNWFAFVMESVNNVDLFYNCIGEKAIGLSQKEIEDLNLSFAKLRIIHFFLWSSYITNDADKSSKEYESFRVGFLEIIDILSMDNLEYKSLNLYKRAGEIKLIEKLRFWQTHYSNKMKSMEQNPMAPIIIQRKVYSVIFKNMGRLSESNQLSDVFNLYIMGVNQFKQYILHDNHHTGFAQFKNHEDIKTSFMERSSYFNNDLEHINSLIYHSVFDKYYYDYNVSQIELRITPANYKKLNRITKIADSINEEAYCRHLSNKTINGSRKKIKFGFIFHYIKNGQEFSNSFIADRNKKLKHKLTKEYKSVQAIFDKSEPLSGRTREVILHSAKSFMENNLYNIDQKNFNKFLRNLNLREYVVEKVLAVDTANLELYNRPEIFADIYRGHRENNLSKSSIKFTYHVGEEFNTISNGLRAIDEVLRFLNFERGDRIGHGLALGMDIEHYFNFKRHKIHTTLEDYIDDIAWMYSLIIDNKEDVSTIPFLLSEFEKYKTKLLSDKYGDVSIHQYNDMYKIRHIDPKKVLKNETDQIIGAKIKQLYIGYHYDPLYKMNAKKRTILDTCDSYIFSVKLAQKILRSKLINLGISIETNPSSNYKISYIRKFIDLPLFSFNKFKLEVNPLGNIPVSINTDDSAIFQSNLSMEYALVGATLLRENYEYESILEYIEHLRVSSYLQSFI